MEAPILYKWRLWLARASLITWWEKELVFVVETRSGGMEKSGSGGAEHHLF